MVPTHKPKESKMKQTVLTMSILFCLTTQCFSAEFNVSTGRQLFNALATAQDNGEDDTITIAPGIYEGEFKFITSEAKGLTITSGGTLNEAILDSGGVSRVFYFYADDIEADFNAYGITFRNGKVSDSNGGGLFIKTKGNIDLDGNNFTQNIAANNLYYGGGLYCNVSTTGTINLSHNKITKNSARYGGGIYLTSTLNCSIYLKNNTIEENTSIYYGGLYASLSSSNEIHIYNNRIANNYSSLYYGGLYVGTPSRDSIIRLKGNTVTGNSTGRFGGGVSVYAPVSEIIFSQNIITNNIVRNNEAESLGAGVYIISAKTTTLLNNIVTENTNKYKSGGGIYIESSDIINASNNLIAKNSALNGAGMYLSPNSTLNFINNTITENFATNNGGGIYLNTSNTQDTINIYNNIIWGNNATNEGDDIQLYGYGGTRNLFNNNYQQITGEWDNKGNNINVASLFFSPEANDYHLQPTSQCINAGTDTAPELPTTDLDGNARIGTVDIGAFEYNTTAMHPADTNQNWIIEESEFTEYNNIWKNRGLWDGSLIPINFMTRAGYIIESGGTYHNSGAGKPICWTSGSGNK